MELCNYGCCQEAKFRLKNGKWCCSDSFNKCSYMRQKNSKSRIGKPHPIRSTAISLRKGKTNREIFGIEKALEIKEKISNTLKKCKPIGKGLTEEIENERKRKISETMKRNKKSGGYRKGSGRGKKGRYKGYWCDSSWELAFVIYSLDNKILLKRNWKKFKYIWNGEEHTYSPDYILSDGTYIEVKGYLTEQATEKIKQFPDRLLVIGNEEMKPILKYVETKYGKDFIKMYDAEECQRGLMALT